MKKGQMFILTMVMLVGLIFAIQNNLSAYSYIDLSQSFERTDFYLMESINRSFGEVIKSPTCEDVIRNAQDLKNSLQGKVINGIEIDLDYSIICIPRSMDLEIKLKALDQESELRERLLG